MKKFFGLLLALIMVSGLGALNVGAAPQANSGAAYYLGGVEDYNYMYYNYFEYGSGGVLFVNDLYIADANGRVADVTEFSYVIEDEGSGQDIEGVGIVGEPLLFDDYGLIYGNMTIKVPYNGGYLTGNSYIEYSIIQPR